MQHITQVCLNCMAKKYLCDPPNSVHTKRLYSKAGELVTTNTELISDKKNATI